MGIFLPAFVFVPFFACSKDATKEERQRAGAMNYLKRKDVEESARCDGGLRAAEERVKGSVGHGLETEERVVVEEMEVRGDGGSGTLEERVEEREEVRDDGRLGTLQEDREEVRDDEGSGTLEERDEAECGPSSEEAPATKRRRLSAIARMGDESLQGWLDSLPRDFFAADGTASLHKASCYFWSQEDGHSCCCQ